MGLGKIFRFLQPKSTLFAKEAPGDIGFNPAIRGDVTTELEELLNNALDPSFIDHVRQRIIQKKPGVDKNKYSWMLLEVKRYFILFTIFKNVKMYSQEVDLIWHEMLLFTQDYQDFCKRFADRFIHHQPLKTASVKQKKLLEERAFFDLMYSILFRIYPENEKLLGTFFKHRVNKKLFPKWVKQSNDSIIENWFYSPVSAAFEKIQHQVINVIKQAYAEHQNDNGHTTKKLSPWSSRSIQSSGYTVNPTLAVMYVSTSKKDRDESDASVGVYSGSSGKSSKSAGEDSGVSNGSADSSCGGGCGSS
jgi:hypothetical protein